LEGSEIAQLLLFLLRLGDQCERAPFYERAVLFLKDEGGKSLLPVNLRDPRERENEIEMDRGYNFDEEKLTSNLT